MKELLNAGQVLGRSEMKKIMAGSGHCTAGFHSCVAGANNDQERIQCRDGYCKCIGCPGCSCP